MALTREYPEVASDVCFTVEGYKGDADYDNTYLGWDRTLSIYPVVTFESMFTSRLACLSFIEWWEEETTRGADIFLVDTIILGRPGTYGIRQISPIVHTIRPDIIKFTAEIIFDSDSVDNTPPSISNYTVYVEENSLSNFIELIADDVDNDSLTYEIVSSTDSAKGSLTGTPPLMQYTPQPSFVGDDSFVFRCNDRWNESADCTVTISVGADVISDFKVKYSITEPVRITGNYHYDNGNGIIQRGTGGFVSPFYTDDSFVSRASTASYIDDGVLTYAAINEARFEDGVLLVEGASTNLCTYSQTFTDSSYFLFGSATATHSQAHIDGSTDAMKFVTSTVLEYQHMQKRLYSPTIPYSSSISASVIVEVSGSYNFFTLRTTEEGFDTYGWVTFDILNGVVSSTNIEGGPGQITGEIELLGNGRFKCTILGSTSNNVLTERYLFMGINETSTYGNIKGNGSSGFILHTVQVEAEEFVTSYIKTSATVVSRAADIANLNLTVYSHDHTVDERDVSAVKSITIEEWGTRKMYKDFFKGMQNAENIIIANDAGICVGENFSGMFWGATGLTNILLFETGWGKDFTDMFRETTALALPSFDYSSGIYFQRMCQDADITVIRDLNSDSGQYFQEMFKDSSLECIGAFNTINQINTTNMFEGAAAIIYPTASDILLLEAGEDWVNGVGCNLELLTITENAPATCEIATAGGTCQSSTTYTITYQNEASAPSFTWEVVGNATITAGSTTDTITVQTNASDVEEVLYINCTVNDGTTSANSGVYTFTHTKTYDPNIFLTIEIEKQYSQLNLRTLIDSKNTTSATEITLLNKITNCAMTTGDLSGLNVTLYNSGEIQAFSPGGVTPSLTKHNGLTLTSTMKLVNTGKIAGCGGYGGSGGRGASDTYLSYVYTERYNGLECESPDNLAFSITHSTGAEETRLYWDGKLRTIAAHTSDWYTISGLSHVYRRKTYKTSIQCSYTTSAYSIERRETTTTSRSGGVGGAGGYGCGYGYSESITDSWRDAVVGAESMPAGGNSGGAGGAGGYWGATGFTGNRGEGYGDYGLIGGAAGKAITGKALLLAGSTTGITYGDLT